MANSTDVLNRARGPVVNDEEERMISRKVSDLTQLVLGRHAANALLTRRTVLAPKLKVYFNVLVVFIDAKVRAVSPPAESTSFGVEHPFQTHLNQNILQALERSNVEDGDGYVDQSNGHLLQTTVPLVASIGVEHVLLELGQTC